MSTDLAWLKKYEDKYGHGVQLPLWDEDLRGVPSTMLRSALFGAPRKGRRRHLENEVVASWAGVEIRYQGKQLDQGDLDVWMQALHECRHSLGERVRVSARGMLKALGKSGGGLNIAWLDQSMLRMMACAVTIKLPDGKKYAGSLIYNFVYDPDDNTYYLELNREIGKLFTKDYTQLSVKVRRALQSNLAKWLHGYVCSHDTRSKPHFVSVEKLRELSGSGRDIRKFAYDLKNIYFPELKRQGEVSYFSVEKGQVIFQR